ncbi:MAG: 4-hydroxy-tetrahydrodipicolinate synthase, partial [Actinomycetota bacterium]|nr:4-hydroxy-tetrahydrodipicolinate synthase [Actinomycetota bacterium]
LDVRRAQELATRLVDAGNDGLVVSGTTGESPTTSDDEKDRLLRAVVEAVGDRAHVVAGVGTYDTRHTVELAQAAEKAGADGLLVVTPFYSKPPQEGLVAHFTTVADATGLPVMLYDIPGRSGVPIAHDTLLRLAEHPRVVANKDAKADVFAAQRVMAATDLAWYSGDDALTLPLLAVGAVGVVSVTAHLVARQHAEMVAAYLAGDVQRARQLNDATLPVVVGVMTRTQGAIMVKAALALLGFPVGGLRLPLVEATAEQVALLRRDLVAGGVL